MYPRIVSGNATTGVDCEYYIFEDGRVAVSRHVQSCKHFNGCQVVAAARKEISEAKSAGQPTDNLTLTEDKYKRFLGVA
jgi:hypothetical protein